MGNEDALEREAFEHFKRQYLSSAEDRADDAVYQLMVAHRYGPGARDPMIPVDWDKVFGEGRCPECADILSLGEGSYGCGRCGLRIPLPQYDKALQEYRKKAEIREADGPLRQRMVKAGYDSHRIGMIYKAAVAEALDELKAGRRRQTMDVKIDSGKRPGSSLTGGDDGKK